MFGTWKPLSLLARSPRPSPSPHPWPLGLTEPEVRAVARLLQTVEGQALDKALNRLVSQNGEQLAGALDYDRYLFLCGAIHALRVVAKLPETLTAHLDTQRTHGRDARDDAGSIFLNSPLWDGWLAAQRPDVAGS